MKCLNCGCTSEHHLCADCTTADILDKIFKEIRFYKPETCVNPYLSEFASNLTEKYAERDIIPAILDLFDFGVSESYHCQYLRMHRDARFEDTAIAYLNTYELNDIRTQNVLYDLIESYIPNDFIKPKKWCELIAESDSFSCELYAVAAKYFAMIGEYELADTVADKGLLLCNSEEHRTLLFYTPENMLSRLEKQKEDTNRYRTKKPYWPATEERRRAVAVFYDERGIEYPRIESRLEKLTEDAAIAYLNTYELDNIRTQNVLYDLIDSYIPNDFIKPKKWCELIAESDNLCCELYAVAAKYFAMIGEYELADTVADKGIFLCNSEENRTLLFYSTENMLSRLEKQKEDTNKYRTKKPYWPATEERRRAVAMFYDEKGIKYPRIESRPEKTIESEFTPIKECSDGDFADYCAFWCADAFSLSPSKSIYQIAAVKVRNGVITEEFQKLIRPWDGAAARKDAANKAGVELSVIEGADDVDLVIPEFFAFVGEDVLISTGALGNQAKLIARAARYAGMREIKNEFYDLLDLAAEISSEFDLSNNTREYLLARFSVAEGKSAIEKAQINKQLYDALKKHGEQYGG